MSGDRPTTREFLLDHLLRIVEGVSREEGEDRTIWTFGFGDDALISLYGVASEPTPEQKAQNEKWKGDAKAQLAFSSFGIEARDHMGVPKRLAKIRGEILSKDRREVAETLKLVGTWRDEEAYACEMLCKLKNVVDRAQKAVPEMHLLPKVPRSVDNYMSEAASCFRYGFDLACISLCRCALEEALKDRISASKGRTFIEVPGVDVNKLIDWAAGPLKVLDPRLQAKAHEIRVSGNDCVHGNLSEEQAKRTPLRVLRHCREIIQDLYST